MIKIKSAVFEKSSPQLKDCPKTDLPEVAFIGRSNVGKSSLINVITGVKNLAQTSSTPGKTKYINHFLVNDAWYLVDLPGFGYAKISRSIREAWIKNLEVYLQRRENLVNVYMLVDGYIPPQKIDIDFANWLGTNQIPFCIVFTKTDRPSKKELNKNVSGFKQELLKTWETLPAMYITSAEKKTGIEEVMKDISKALKEGLESKK